jgi:hypothetical protein
MTTHLVDILWMKAGEMSLDAAQILAEMPDWETDHLKACMMFVRRLLDHPVLAATSRI